MSAIRLLQAERKEEIQHLHRQFMSGGILQRELWEEAEKFLIQREIYDVILAEEQDLREYKQTLLDSGNYTKKQVKEQSSALRKIQKYWIETEYGELSLLSYTGVPILLYPFLFFSLYSRLLHLRLPSLTLFRNHSSQWPVVAALQNERHLLRSVIFRI